MKAAIYYRVSTLEQAEGGYSVGEQQERLTAFCKAKGWELVGTYGDPGVSGAKLDRPGLNKLIEDCNKHLFDVVAVYKLDRLSRSQKDTLYLIEDVFEKNNIAFVSMQESFDTTTPIGKATIGFTSIFAQFERDQITERLLMGKIGLAKAGKATAWAGAAFGYINDKENQTYIVDELRAPIVKDIYKRYLAGTSLTKLAQQLNDEGHVGKTNPWSYQTVQDVLSNPVYTGKVVFSGKTYPGLHDPIISEEEFDEVQQLRAKRQQFYTERFNARPFKSKFLLSGLLKCGLCGSTLSIRDSRTKHGKHRFYRCPASTNRRADQVRGVEHCSNDHRYDMKEMEATIMDEVKRLKFNKPELEQSQEDAKEQITKQINEIKKQRERLVDLYLNGKGINMDSLNERSELLEKQQKTLEDKLAKQAKDKTVNKAYDELLSVDLDTLPLEKKKYILNQIISSIDVVPGALKIHWNFQS